MIIGRHRGRVRIPKIDPVRDRDIVRRALEGGIADALRATIVTADHAHLPVRKLPSRSVAGGLRAKMRDRPDRTLMLDSRRYRGAAGGQRRRSDHYGRTCRIARSAIPLPVPRNIFTIAHGAAGPEIEIVL